MFGKSFVKNIIQDKSGIWVEREMEFSEKLLKPVVQCKI